MSTLRVQRRGEERDRDLVVLVSMFAGRERVLEAYREAVAQRYRFYSYGARC